MECLININNLVSVAFRELGIKDWYNHDEFRKVKGSSFKEDDYIQVESASQLELIYNIAKIPFDKKIVNWEGTYAYNCFYIKTGIRKSVKGLKVGENRIISFGDFIKDNLETGGSASTDALPKYWCIRITETNISTLRMCVEIPTYQKGLYLGVCEKGGLGIFTESKVSSKAVISLQEFQKHVLKTEIKQITNDNTVNSTVSNNLYNSNSSQFKQPENGKIAIVQITNLEITTGNPVRGIGLESPRSEIIVGNHSSDYKKRSSTSKKGVLWIFGRNSRFCCRL